MSCHVMSCHVLSCYVMLSYVMSCTNKEVRNYLNANSFKVFCYVFQFTLVGVIYLGYIGAYLQHGKDRRFRWCGYICVFVHMLYLTIMVMTVYTTNLIVCAVCLYLCLRIYVVSAKLFWESFILLLCTFEYSSTFTFDILNEMYSKDFAIYMYLVILSQA